MILKNATLLLLAPATVARADLRVEGGTIVGRAANLRPARGEETVDLSGRCIMPGMVNAHTHLYSTIARGMPAPRQLPRNFLEILRRVWWKLDESLDEESIYYSALVGAIEAVKYGTTTIIDHHASPNSIAGSLDIIKKAVSIVGLRGVLCYETTDRGGRRRREMGLQENERFVTENANNACFRGAMGAHASFTLDDDTMRALGELAGMYDCGVHMHVAEAKADVEDARRRMDRAFMKKREPARGAQHGRSRRIQEAGTLARLDKFGLLTPKSILAHGVHLTRAEIVRIGESGAWLVHNPRSNMNNAVGYAPLRWFGRHAALGTDGFPADMFEESKLGFFRNQESEHKATTAALPGMLQAGQKLVSGFFGREFGTLKEGAPADLIVLDYAAPTRVNAVNLHGHFLFGMNSGMVIHTMANGRWSMFNRRLVGIDEEKVMGEAARIAQKLWRRMRI